MRARTLTPPKRFGFGENWRSFVSVVDDERIRTAEESLRTMLDVPDLRGRTFLDLGCGSGLFSLAAANLGAERIHSFDYDADSVRATTEMRARHGHAEVDWTIERGDATDTDYVRSLGQFDVVYAWGVLHHTGAMWRAMENAIGAVAPGGKFFTSIYNDQGRTSRRWLKVKKLYNRLPAPARVPYAVAVMLPSEARSFAGATVRGRPMRYIGPWLGERERGMSRWHDLIDWVGGYPFEVAKPEEVFDFCHERGLELEKLTTVGNGLGCNQFVFRRAEST